MEGCEWNADGLYRIEAIGLPSLLPVFNNVISCWDYTNVKHKLRMDRHGIEPWSPR